jgi:aspartate-semialdehyde dehydrogenase
MNLGNESLRVAIVGATSLRGKDLKQWMEESGFPSGEIRLLDEDLAVGTLTEAAGEPVIVQRVDESSFAGMRFVFFTGTPEFAKKHAMAAERAGATVIDMTGGLAGTPGARSWIPHLDAELAPPASGIASPSGIKEDEAVSRISLCIAPSAPAIVACSLAVALKRFPLQRLAITFFQPVSERGQAGVEELESQTVKLLSLQPIPQKVFDTQVAFNLLDRWGPESSESLNAARLALAREVREYLLGRVPAPALSIVQAPVFFGYTFTAYAEFGFADDSAPLDPELLSSRLSATGFDLVSETDPAVSNTRVAGESRASLTQASRDPNVSGGHWFWGAADNLRLASANALRIAERLLVS